MIDGVLYTSTSGSQAAAIDAETGETLWIYDPRSWASGRPPNNGFLHRGVAAWTDGSGGPLRIFLATGDARLIALDAATGTPIEASAPAARSICAPASHASTAPPSSTG